MCCLPCCGLLPLRPATIIIAILLSCFFLSLAVEEIASKTPFMDRLYKLKHQLQSEAEKRGLPGKVAAGLGFFYFGASLFLLVGGIFDNKVYVLLWLIVFFPMLAILISALIILILEAKSDTKIEGIVFYSVVLAFFVCFYCTVMKYFLPLV